VSGYYGAPSHLKNSAPARPAEPVIAPATEAQARCDEIQAEYRAQQQRRSIRRDPPPTPKALVPCDDVLNVRLAEELDYARRMLDLMGDALTADPSVLVRHGVALQSVDIIGQIMGHIAAVIRSSDPAGAVDRIGMADLKSRLTRQSI
jgi:hypothetical protein